MDEKQNTSAPETRENVAAALRALLMILLCVGIVKTARRIFLYIYIDEGSPFSDRALAVLFGLTLLVVFRALVSAFHAQDAVVREAYLTAADRGRLRAALRFLLKKPPFYLEIAVIAAVSLAAPRWVCGFAIEALFGKTPTAAETYSAAGATAAALVLIDFLAQVSILRGWYNRRRADAAKKKKKCPLPPWCGRAALVALVAFGVAAMSSWYLPAFVTLYYLDRWGWLWIFPIVGAVVLLNTLLRAVRKRKSFVKKLKKYCAANGIALPEVKHPIRSMFAPADGYDFRIEKNGKIYDCKLLAGINYYAPMVLTDRGNGTVQRNVRFLKLEFVRVLKSFEFGFESEGKKVLILTPAPKQFFTLEEGKAPHLADTGEPIGDYTVYTATGFLGALDRDCLCVRAKMDKI